MKHTYLQKKHHKKDTQLSRNAPFVFLGLCFAILGILLWIRIGYLQIIAEKPLASRAKRQQTTLASVQGKRGAIVDRNNNVLARSIAMQTISINTRLVKDKRDTAKKLAAILKKSEQEIFKALQESKRNLLIARKVSQPIAEQIRSAELPGVSVITEYGRVYPYKDIAGILLGFVGDDNTGLEGVEYAMDERLRGRVEQQRLVRDARGKKLFFSNTIEPEELEGETIQLTLDMHIQYIAEEALEHTVKKYQAKWAGALVVDVPSGDILAWAEAPRFNPNNFKSAKPEDWRNRLATDAYEPGSIFKPFLFASALEEGVINPDSLIFCEGGAWKIGDTTIHDDTGKFQWLPVSDVLAKSSNIGMAKIGLALGIKQYLSYIQRFGFGAATPLPLPQSPGIARFDRYWSDVDIATLSFGQGIAVTGVQLAQAALIIANGGVFQPLRIFMDQQNTTYPYRIISEKNVHIVRSILRKTVESGTGKRAAIPGVDIGGKTGTAQKAHAGTYGEERFASFIGMFPTQQPEYVIVVLVNEPQVNIYGGIVAIPVFKEITEHIIAYKNVGAKKTPQPTPRVPNNTTVSTAPIIRKPIIPIQQKTLSSMPNMHGMHIRNAVETLSQIQIIPTIYGNNGIVIKQDPPPGTPIKNIKKVTLWLADET